MGNIEEALNHCESLYSEAVAGLKGLSAISPLKELSQSIKEWNDDLGIKTQRSIQEKNNSCMSIMQTLSSATGNSIRQVNSMAISELIANISSWKQECEQICRED